MHEQEAEFAEKRRISLLLRGRASGDRGTILADRAIKVEMGHEVVDLKP